MKKNFSPFFASVLMVLTSFTTNAMEVVISGSSMFHNTPLKSTQVEAIVGNKVIAMTFADLAGDYSLSFRSNQAVVLAYSKAGFASKKILLDINPNDGAANKTYTMEHLDVRLFKAYDHIDMALLEEPIAKIKYVAKTDRLTFDLDYNLRVQESLEQLRNLVERVESSDMHSYDQYIRMAENAADEEEWETAKHFYHKAMDLNPDMVEDLNRLISDLNSKAWYARQHNKLVPSTERQESANETYITMYGKQYPPGLTEEVEKYPNKVVVKRIIVADNAATVYERVDHNWGGTFYFKNNESITQRTWEMESLVH